MSRIGKAPIAIPAGVTVTVKGNDVTVKGPKGELSQTVNPDIAVEVKDGHVYVTRPSDDKEHRSLHGLYRALIHNMVAGVSEGYKKGSVQGASLFCRDTAEDIRLRCIALKNNIMDDAYRFFLRTADSNSQPVQQTFFSHFDTVSRKLFVAQFCGKFC